MPPPLSKELRDEIQAHIELGRETPQIVHSTGVSCNQINKMKRNLARYGDVVGHRQVMGPPRLMTPDMEDHLLEWIDEHPTKYTDEMCWFIYDHYDVIVSERTMCRVLKGRKWTHKKAAYRALQRDQGRRDAWRARACGWKSHQLMFLDEAAACERTGDRKYGWAQRGAKAVVPAMFKQSERWSILPAYTTRGYIAWQIHHGSITQEIFNDFVRYDVLPLSTRAVYGGVNSVLICDNATAHKSLELREMCLEAGVELAFLPPYSPDYNPIETSFAILKRWMKKHGQELAESYGPSPEDFERFLHDAVLAQGNRAHPGRLFRAAGYAYDGI